MKFRSDMAVELISSNGSDTMVAAAARVSTVGAQANAGHDELSGLINFLMKNRHGTPFEHNIFTFMVSAPIFVWREHMRHRVASYNEESGRYRKLEPVFYIPDENRPLRQVGKAGAYQFEHHEDEEVWRDTAYSLQVSSQRAYERYEYLLEKEVAREVARMALPVNIYSTAFVSMNARGLMNFLSLRTKSDASLYTSFPQREIEMVAEQYEEHFARLMPITHAAFVAAGRVAP